jgi:glycosyltransferase involved in cell wall biosynthesis
MPMRILMLLDNPCDPDPRVEREAEALANAGHTVHICCWNRDSGERATLKRNAVTIERFPPGTKRKLGYKQIVFLLNYMRRVTDHVDNNAPYDLLYCHDMFMLFLGCYLKRKYHWRLVYDAHEIYEKMEWGRLPLVWLKACALLERFCIRRYADSFVTVSKQRYSDYFAKRVAKKPYIVGNWYDEVVGARPVTSPRFVLGYCGALNGNRALELLAQLAERRDDVDIVVAGRGDAGLEARLAQCASTYPHFRFLGWQAKPFDVIAGCDCLFYAITEGHPYQAFAAPNNLFMAIAAQRPIIAFAGGEIARLAVPEKAIVLLKAASVDLLSVAIDQVRLRRPEWSLEARVTYTWKNATATLLAAVDAASGQGRDTPSAFCALADRQYRQSEKVVVRSINR